MYDSIIIGTGPAGLSAALNLKTYKKGFYLVWFEEPKRKGAKRQRKSQTIPDFHR